MPRHGFPLLISAFRFFRLTLSPSPPHFFPVVVFFFVSSTISEFFYVTETMVAHGSSETPSTIERKTTKRVARDPNLDSGPITNSRPVRGAIVGPGRFSVSIFLFFTGVWDAASRERLLELSSSMEGKRDQSSTSTRLREQPRGAVNSHRFRASNRLKPLRLAGRDACLYFGNYATRDTNTSEK